jgi:glutathione S-transferase
VKLYFMPGACSLSPHIVLREAGLNFEVEQVDGKTKQTKAGQDFLKINPKGYVPTLQLDNGDVLTEGPAIVQYLADQKPESGLAPKSGTFERSRLQEWLNFITTELHKGFSPLFKPTTPEDYKGTVREALFNRIAYVDKQLAGKQYLMGDKFTVADAYAFTVLNWSNFQKLDLTPYANVTAYMARVKARPKVQEALKAEGLLK